MQRALTTDRLQSIAGKLLIPVFFLVLALVAYRFSFDTRGPVDEEILFLECAAAQTRCPLGIIENHLFRPLHALVLGLSYYVFSWHFPPYLLWMPLFQWLNGWVYYLVLRKLFPRHHLLALAAALLFLLYPADATRTFIGIIGVAQAILTFLVALWLMLSLADGSMRSPIAWIGMVLCLLIGPLSYEQLVALQFCLPFILLVYPSRGLTPLRKRIAIVWWATCLLFVGYRILMALLVERGAYPFSRYEGPLLGYIQEWLKWFTTGSIPVWLWAIPRARAAIALGSPEVRQIPLAVTLGMLLVTGLVGLFVHRRSQPESESGNPSSLLYELTPFAAFLVLGLALAFLNYGIVPYAYLVKPDHLDQTTRFHSGAALGFCLSIAALISGVARLISHLLKGRFYFVLAWLPITLLASISLYSQMYVARHWAVDDWSRKQAIWSSIIELAPDVRSDTLIVLVNPPNYNDPRGTNYVMGMSRFLYDDRTLNGDYIGDNANILTHITLTPDGIILPDVSGQVAPIGDPPIFYPYEDVLFINLGDGQFRSSGSEGLDPYLLTCLPDNLLPPDVDEACNDPANVILDGPPSPTARAWLDLP